MDIQNGFDQMNKSIHFSSVKEGSRLLIIIIIVVAAIAVAKIFFSECLAVSIPICPVKIGAERGRAFLLACIFKLALNSE